MTDTTIFGLDSETVTDSDGSVRCTLIACSDGSYLAGHDIRTDAALRYITTRRGELWTFFGDYDINFWVRDFSPQALDRLRRTGWARRDRWRIHHIPRRLFEVWDTRTERYVRVYDIYSFVQTSFVAWLRSWNLADADTIARIEAMKAKRAEFITLKPQTILKYTQAEVALIAKGAGMLKQRIRSAGLGPRMWLGPGAVAATALRQHKIKDYMPERTHPRAEQAYFGGRIETSAVGMVRGPLWYYDIVSAYPHAAVTLPCFRHGAWAQTKTPRGIALCYIEWEPAGNVPGPLWGKNAVPVWGPFPTRISSTTTLRYYAESRGWFWYDEIDPWLKSKEYRIRFGLCWQWNQICSHRPFEWIQDLFRIRQSLKRVEDPIEYAYKLVLNSIYGKLAQRIGRAPYWCPEWAGLITARVRGRIGQILVDHGQDVLVIATDGIISSCKLPFGKATRLGAWGFEGKFTSADLWQPGFYILSDGRLRTRGYSRVEVDPQVIRKAWLQESILGLAPLRKRYLVGYRLAAAQGRWQDFCRWTDQVSELSLNPLPRRWLADDPASSRAGGLMLRTRAPTSLAIERSLRFSGLTKDPLGEYEEDGCEEGFARD